MKIFSTLGDYHRTLNPYSFLTGIHLAINCAENGLLVFDIEYKGKQ